MSDGLTAEMLRETMEAIREGGGRSVYPAVVWEPLPVDPDEWFLIEEG